MSSKCVTSEIKRFYSGKNLLVTGALGFCGRVLLEKILRTLDVGQIFLLVRSRPGLSAQERVDRLLRSRLFSFHNYPESTLKKLVVFESDISQPMLGLNSEQVSLLFQKVNVLFHFAASVKFNASFRTNFNCNVLGTLHVIKFAKQHLPNLNAFVHLSTAYSNCHLTHIEERLYDMDGDVDELVQQISAMGDEELQQKEAQLLQSRPNSYILTKSMAEQVIRKHRGQIKVAIARAAVVSPSISEPIAGWIDNLNGPAGFSLVCSLGIGQVTDWNFDRQIDCFPVDFVANCLISIGWDLETNEPKIKSEEDIRVFNLVSTPLKPLDNYELLKKGKELMEECPSLYVIRPPAMPPKICRMSQIEFQIKKFFYHTVFAYFVDLILLLIGRKPIMRQAVQRMHFAQDLMRYFAFHDWSFRCDHVIELCERMNSEDRRLFDFDIRPRDPEQVSRSIWLGIRRYLLNESDKTIPAALIKYKIQIVLYQIYQWTLKYYLLKWTLALLLHFTIFREMVNYTSLWVNDHFITLFQ